MKIIKPKGFIIWPFFRKIISSPQKPSLRKDGFNPPSVGPECSMTSQSRGGADQDMHELIGEGYTGEGGTDGHF